MPAAMLSEVGEETLALLCEQAADAGQSRARLEELARRVAALGTFGVPERAGPEYHPPMSGRHWRGVAVTSLAMVAALAQAADAGSGLSFSTPEAAVEHFVKNIAADDVDAAMQAFAVKELAARAHVAAKARVKSGLPRTGPLRLPKSRIYDRILEINLRAEFAGETRRFVYALLLDNGMDDQMTEASDANLDRFVRAANPARLRGLKIVRIDQPVPSVTRTAKAIEQAKVHASWDGADDSTERIALFELGGKHYRGGFTLLRYGKTWRVRRLSSVYAGGDHGRPVRATTPKEYLELTK
jgi:hypothetical protein